MKRRAKSQSGEEAKAPSNEGAAPGRVPDVPEGRAPGLDEVERIRAEIRELRAALAHKTLELRALGGQEPGGVSDTVQKVLELLRREEGATKAQLVEATGAKEAYVAALLNRILPNKGYSISSTVLQGAKVKTYRLPQAATG